MDKWYILQVYSGKENLVKKLILDKLTNLNKQDCCKDIIIPEEEITEIKQGVKKTRKKKLFPGYIIINIDLDIELFSMIKAINHVASFLGTDKELPAPMSKTEIGNLLSSFEKGSNVVKRTKVFEIGQVVKVVSGPLEGFTGQIEEIDQTKSKLKVSMNILGRTTNVDLDLDKVEKV